MTINDLRLVAINDRLLTDTQKVSDDERERYYQEITTSFPLTVSLVTVNNWYNLRDLCLTEGYAGLLELYLDRFPGSFLMKGDLLSARCAGIETFRVVCLKGRIRLYRCNTFLGVRDEVSELNQWALGLSEEELELYNEMLKLAKIY